MNRDYRIYMAGGATNYANWFPFPYTFVNDLEEANVIWYEGGCDIDPVLYSEQPGKHTYFSAQMSKYDLALWNFAKDKKIFKIGTCKGLQSLSVFNGGKIAQHTRHPSYHPVITKEGTFHCISLHHQQAILDESITKLKEGRDYELIGYCEKLSPFHLNDKDNDYKFGPEYKEPEIVYFPTTGSWGVQSHPEMMGDDSPFVQYCQESVREKVTEFFKS